MTKMIVRAAHIYIQMKVVLDTSRLSRKHKVAVCCMWTVVAISRDDHCCVSVIR